VDAVQTAIENRMYADALDTELRIRDFMFRTGLTVDQIALVSMPSGRLYPQWKHAVPPMPPCDEEA
jgi:hypothetical protein